MGIIFSCLSNDYEIFEAANGTVTLRSLSFKGDEVVTTVRSVSFRGRDNEPTLLGSLGSGQMIIESSVNFKERDENPSLLETAILVGTSILSKECARLTSFKEPDVTSPPLMDNNLVEEIPPSPDTCPGSPQFKAAVQLQKVYRSFRTRRKLADCAVHWWTLLDFAVLERSSVLFFDIDKPESVGSKWYRAGTRVAKVGKGLCKDDKARKLALQHWLEAIDPRHRYGHNLHFYFASWLNCTTKEPFFYWLNVGEGRDCDLKVCSRSKLQKQCIKYLGPEEREAYQVIVEDGKLLFKQSWELVDTSEKAKKDSKWIFVLSTSKKLYVGQKKKGTFQHSSFLAGGATSAAGRLESQKGVLKALWPHSGHYRPTVENFEEFLSFLRENGVDLTDAKLNPTGEDAILWEKQCSLHIGIDCEPTELDLEEEEYEFETVESTTEKEPLLKQSNGTTMEGVIMLESKRVELASEAQFTEVRSTKVSMESQVGLDEAAAETDALKEYTSYTQNFFDNGEDEDNEVPKESILLRISSKKEVKSYQLGKQLSCKWSTGAGPRIGCVRDYPIQMQTRALKQMDLFPGSVRQSRSRSFPENRTDASLQTCASHSNMTSGQSRSYSLPSRHATSPSPLSTKESNININNSCTETKF